MKVLMPLCLSRVENVFALFFKSAVWIRADEKQKCVGLSISYSFLELFKRWTEKAVLSRAKFVCYVHGAIVWFGAVRYEDAGERAAR